MDASFTQLKTSEYFFPTWIPQLEKSYLIRWLEKKYCKEVECRGKKTAAEVR